LRRAIEVSCDTYFYNLGKMVGVDKIHKWATRLGLGVKSNIDLPNEVTGLVPSSEWKRLRFKEPWYPGETISVAIGQGQVSVTPISMAVYMAAIANGGRRVTPHLMKAVDDGSGWKAQATPEEQGQSGISPETINSIHDGMWGVVNAGGTGGNARIQGYDVSGKTGTVQVISLDAAKALKGRTDLDLRDHGWFVFFAPRDDPKIAGAVFTEHGEHGTTAALITRYILETYFAAQEGRALPVFKAPVKPAPKPAAIVTQGVGQ
jgi:penicillin-binding protein 2